MSAVVEVKRCNVHQVIFPEINKKSIVLCCDSDLQSFSQKCIILPNDLIQYMLYPINPLPWGVA